ncbi:MAG TPA: class I SAM-dependent methyltransferase [Pyrinomonadaceae bacterium]
MGTTKSDKELAFLKELFVATDWGERFSALMDKHVQLPKRGQMLYVAAGTGGHAMAMQERAGDDVTLACVDESEECLELGRAKAAAVKAEPEFYRAQLEALSFEDDQFDLVIGDASLVAAERLPEMLSEMVRVAQPGGTVALGLPTHSSFGEFFSIYWEALLKAGFEKHEHDVESLITELPTISAVEEMAEREGLEGINTWTQIEEFEYESGEEFLNAPLITDFLLKAWLESLPGEEAQARVAEEITGIIDEERQDMNFILSVKATLLVGRKAEAE